MKSIDVAKLGDLSLALDRRFAVLGVPEHEYAFNYTKATLGLARAIDRRIRVYGVRRYSPAPVRSLRGVHA